MTANTVQLPGDVQTSPVHTLQQRAPTGLLIVTMVLYTGFAIPVSIVALAQSLPIGVVLSAFLAWQWGRLPGLLAGTRHPASMAPLAPQVPQTVPLSSGNASFDAYRSDLLSRLEQEQLDFEGFVARLRDAKDKAEFDDYMEAREARVRSQAGQISAA